ncbi:MAG: 5-carboxymethyl-2-hydroxymuconate isomerase [Paracoccaceae bacterium]|jgi:5-carboxymethyl-2-hydroxymuconate isomerase
MPHMDITYSRNLGAKADIDALCTAIGDAMAATGIFPLGGTRVRAICCDAYVIADRDPANAFADMVLRIGAGRTPAVKKTAGDAIWAAACAHLAALFDTPHFALSFEIREMEPDLSWKKNSIHARLKI